MRKAITALLLGAVFLVSGVSFSDPVDKSTEKVSIASQDVSVDFVKSDIDVSLASITAEEVEMIVVEFNAEPAPVMYAGLKSENLELRSVHRWQEDLSIKAKAINSDRRSRRISQGNLTRAIRPPSLC